MKDDKIISASKWEDDCTLLGSLKEFSSITLLDVNVVFTAPTDVSNGFCPNPLVEILRVTVLVPKFTTWRNYLNI